MVMIRFSPSTRGLLLGAAALSLACEPTFDDRNSEVLGRRVLAVKTEPAQAKPGAELKLSALVVEPGGTLRDFPLDWAFCNAPKPIAETNDVSGACVTSEGEQIEPLGSAPSVTAKMPKDACRLFGPDTPPAMSGEPPGRPTDPDSTGSYYQPLRVIAPDAPQPIWVMAQAGLVCSLPSATGEQLKLYQQRVRENAHPAIESVLIAGDQNKPLSVDDDKSEVTRVEAGERVTLRVSWPACPTSGVCGDGVCSGDETASGCAEDCMMPKGCAGAETFVYYDPEQRKVVERREAMRVAWFAGAGEFKDDHTGRRENESETFSDGVWTAPSQPGRAHLWVVLRDNRSGIAWQSYVIDVR
jgi:hypothetical protein